MKNRIPVKFFLFLLLLFYPISLCAEEYIIRYPQLGIKMSWDKSAKAVIVDDVKKDSNVYKAGLRPGDVISMIGMAAPSSLLGVRYEILDLTPGEPGKLSYKRNGELKWAQFIIETKEYKTFYNNNLTKHEFSRTDHKSMLNLGITRYGFSKYIQYTSNYLTLLQKVETGEFDPKVAAYSAISGFYYLYDKSKKSKLDKDIYAAVNHRFYTIINSISAKIFTDFKASKIKKSDGELVKFVDTIYEYYYMPNYAEFPEIQKQTANLNAMKEILAKFETDALKKAEEKAAALKRQKDLEKKKKQAELSASASNIENKYRSNTGGWQDLKWGMTVDDVRLILKNNGDELRDAGSNEYGIILNFQDSDSVLTKSVKEYYDNQGPLYFYSGKLMGRLVDISSSEYIDNHQFITKSLKEKYPDGKVFTKTGHGFGYGGVKYHHFFYKSQDLNVFTLNVPAGYGGGGVYYYDPVAIEKIKMNETNNAKEIENKKKQKLKNKF